jgi:RNA polymerase primary sigma factor
MAESQQQSRLKALIAKGKEQGYLTYAEVNDHLPEDISDPDQVEDIIQMINDMGIKVFEQAPDADDLMMDSDGSSDDIAAAEAAAALAAVENEAGRTTDPVRMYMREMGTVELLTREGEIVIAKRIEEGIRELMAALSYWPGAVEHVLDEYALVAKEERRLTDIISGYLDPYEQPIVPPQQNTGDDDDDEDDEPGGLDPVEAESRFTELRVQNDKVNAAIDKHGRYSKQVGKELEKLGEVFKFFKLSPRQFEPLTEIARSNLMRIRKEERQIMNWCIRYAKMPRKDFITEFQGNETNDDWILGVIASGEPYAERLMTYQEEIVRAQRRIGVREATVGITVTDIKEINRRMSIGEARMRRAKKEMDESNHRLEISIAKKYTNSGQQI